MAKAQAGWDDDALDESEAGESLVGTLIFEEEGEAKTTKAFKKIEENRKRKPWEQEVLDEQGRKRLHGAFTGGFSAGYFNTVGSKEGWAPATFVSSRSNRAKYDKQRLEDFMDAEDIAEEQTGGMDLHATDAFAGMGGSKDTIQPPKDVLIPEDLLAPAEDPIGFRLLRVMGWRDGHGVGPRRKRTREQRGEAGEEDGEGEEGEYLMKDFKFAPKDVQIFEATVKNDLFGVGYDPLANTPDFTSLLHVATEGAGEGERAGGRGGQRVQLGSTRGDGGEGGAFGLGMDEEADEDGGGRGAGEYDTEIGLDEEDEEAMMEALRQPKARGKKDNLKGGKRGPVPVDVAAVMAGMGKGRKCNDGRAPLKGFLLSREQMGPTAHYPPPEIPKDFAPFHRFNEIMTSAPDWKKEVEALPTSLAECSKDQLLALAMGRRPAAPPPKAPARPQLTANQRAEMLGEAPLPLVSAAAAAAAAAPGPGGSGGGGAGAGRGTYAERAAEAASRSMMTAAHTEKVQSMLSAKFLREGGGGAGAGAGGGAFKPFAHNAEKQARYEDYLENREAARARSLARTAGLRPHEVEREREEFEKSAAMFGGRKASEEAAVPGVGGGLASRFGAGSQGGGDPAEEAAQAGMYGRMTRSREEWRPDRLLCKRFNVPDPFFGVAPRRGVGGGGRGGGAAAKDGGSRLGQGFEELKFLLPEAPPPALGGGGAGKEGSAGGGAAGGEGVGGQGAGSAGARAQGGGGAGVSSDAPVASRPPEDIFKSIFDDDDDDDSEEEAAAAPAEQSAGGGGAGAGSRSAAEAFASGEGENQFKDGIELARARTEGATARFQNVVELPDFAEIKRKLAAKNVPPPVTPPGSDSDSSSSSSGSASPRKKAKKSKKGKDKKKGRKKESKKEKKKGHKKDRKKKKG